MENTHYQCSDYMILVQGEVSVDDMSMTQLFIIDPDPALSKAKVLTHTEGGGVQIKGGVAIWGN